MKKTIITLMALACSVGVAATTPEWVIADHGNGTATYSITLTGDYTIDLGEAAIKGGESFTMTVETEASGWANGWGTGLVGTKDPYGSDGSNDNFRVYFGHVSSNEKLVYNLNGWAYEQSSGDACPDYSGVAESGPLTLGFTFTFVNSDDALEDGENETSGGGNYFTIANSQNSDVTFSYTDYNIVGSFNFATLTNESTTASMPSGAVTTISITKAYSAPDTPGVPEPATATLSLLALAGLAARRRRK